MMELPRVVQLELTTRCNVACRFCNSTLTGWDMDWRAVEATLPLISPGCQVSLFGNGEGLLYPRFMEALHAVKERGAYTFVSTNGMAVATRGAAELAAAGLDRIAISIAGPDPALHEEMQVGVDSAQVWEAVRDCAAAGIDTWVIFIVMRRNLYRCVAMADRVADAGAHAIAFQEMMSGRMPDAETVRTFPDIEWQRRLSEGVSRAQARGLRVDVRFIV